MELGSPRTSIADLQRYVAETEIRRGFDRESALQKCLLLGEEVGELFKSVRRHSGIKIDEESDATDVGEELADVLNFVLAISNRFDIDLAKAFASKEKINESRTWV